MTEKSALSSQVEVYAEHATCACVVFDSIKKVAGSDCGF